MVVITDESTACEIAEALGHANRRAKRAPHVIGTREYPTAWDRAHELVDQILTDWERVAH